MAANDKKKYFWLKLKKDFFQQHQIRVLKALPNGRLYALIYLELLAESTSHEGELRFSKMLPYDNVTLAAVIDEDPDNVKAAIDTFVFLELAEILDDGTIFMTEIQHLIGSETGQAQRRRESRAKIKEVQMGTNEVQNTLENRDKSIEIRDKNNIYIPDVDDEEDPEEEPKTHIYKRIIDYLNEKTGKKLRVGGEVTRLIDARLNAGACEQDFYTVIDNKCDDWLQDPKMSKYLRPVTLFGTKFDGYLNEEHKKIEDKLPVYDTSNNTTISDEEEMEIMKSMGGANWERYKREHGIVEETQDGDENDETQKT